MTMKKSLSRLALLAAAAGIAIGAAQGVQAQVSKGWFFAAPTGNTGFALVHPSGWQVNYTSSLSAISGGRVQPTWSNQMFGEPTPFTAAVLVGCQVPRSSQASLGQRSWTFNSAQSYTALTKSCLGFGLATAMQGTMTINI
jgi:hypothetical protein